jgi:hypothetical protein
VAALPRVIFGCPKPLEVVASLWRTFLQAQRRNPGGDVGLTRNLLLRTVKRSVLSLSQPQQPECLAILLEVGRREVVNFVLFQKGVHLHARFETGQPAKLSARKRVAPVGFECQAFKRCARQIHAEAAVDQRLWILLRMYDEAFRQLGGVPEPHEDGLAGDAPGEIIRHPVFKDSLASGAFQSVSNSRMLPSGSCTRKFVLPNDR